MQIALNVDNTHLLYRLDKPEKRIAFAVVNAINATAKVAQRAVQLRVQDSFTIRQPFVLRQAAIIKPFASVPQGRPYAEISVGQRSRLLLSGFEQGFLREPFKGKGSVAVPIEARPSKGESVPRDLYVKELDFKRPKALTADTRRRRRAGLAGRVWEGKHGTYEIPKVGIFQRISATITRTLYVFARPFQIKKRLSFFETILEVARRVFSENLRREIRESLERRR